MNKQQEIREKELSAMINCGCEACEERLIKIELVQRETALAVWERQWDFLHGLWYANKINQEVFDLFREQLSELRKELEEQK